LVGTPWSCKGAAEGTGLEGSLGSVSGGTGSAGRLNTTSSCVLVSSVNWAGSGRGLKQRELIVRKQILFVLTLWRLRVD
jgi:hypothetical protein